MFGNTVQGGLAMDKNAKIKNHMIEVTTELIEKHHDSIKDITARMIAAKADVRCILQNYTENCDSVLTQQSFSLSLENDISNMEKFMIVFFLTSAMQAAFLGVETVKPLLGYDFTKTEDSAAYIRKLVDILFEGTVRTDE
jgi:hypothetical protein